MPYFKQSVVLCIDNMRKVCARKKRKSFQLSSKLGEMPKPTQYISFARWTILMIARWRNLQAEWIIAWNQWAKTSKIGLSILQIRLKIPYYFSRTLHRARLLKWDTVKLSRKLKAILFKVQDSFSFLEE